MWKHPRETNQLQYYMSEMEAKEAYDCQTPLIFMARHDALSAIVCHRKDVLQGTGLMAAGYSNGLQMSIA